MFENLAIQNMMLNENGLLSEQKFVRKLFFTWGLKVKSLLL